jgi:hypothetical protein
VQTFPQVVGILQDTLPGANLDITYHFTGKTFPDEWTDRYTGSAVKAGKRRIITVLF